jgi:hypothetical protein
MAAHEGPASLRPRCTRSGSSVATIPGYRGVAFRLSKGQRFSLPRIVQTDTGAYPAFYAMVIEEVDRPEHEADHLHLVARLRMCGGRGVGKVH